MVQVLLSLYAAAHAREVSCPALILHGDRDAHIPVAHSELLANVMRKSGNEDLTLLIFNDHNQMPDDRIVSKYFSSLFPHW
jgi:dipeptidyl aminopeptidase/acylaminoacyl peptidase